MLETRVTYSDVDKGYIFDGFDEFRRAKRNAPEPTVTVNQSLDLDDGTEKVAQTAIK